MSQSTAMKGERMETNFKLSNKVRLQSMMSLSVENVGRQKCTPGYAWGPGMRDHYLLHYISSGSGTYETGGAVYALTAGDAFLALPETEICYQADENDPWTYEWVGFSGTDAGAIIARTSFSETKLVQRKISCGEALRAQLGRINDAFGNAYTNALRMTGELYVLLAILAEDAEKEDPMETSRTERVRKAVEYIASRYSYGISVEEIASYVGVSRSTLFREFREELAISPKEYLDRYRLRRAAWLLENTDLKVSSVATSVGYEGGLYFSRVFRKFTGKTPSEYRAGRSGQDEENPASLQ